MSGIVILLTFWLYLDASISTRLPGSPSMHRLQAATWPARLSAGRESADVSIGGLDMRRGNDKGDLYSVVPGLARRVATSQNGNRNKKLSCSKIAMEKH